MSTNPTRKTKEIKLGNRLITVNELLVREIKAFWKDLSNLQPVMGLELSPELQKIWGIAVEGITIEETEDYTPSSLKLIYDAFREVNEVFFDLAAQLEGDNPMLVALRNAALLDLANKYMAANGSTNPSADSLNEAT